MAKPKITARSILKSKIRDMIKSGSFSPAPTDKSANKSKSDKEKGKE